MDTNPRRGRAGIVLRSRNVHETVRTLADVLPAQCHGGPWLRRLRSWEQLVVVAQDHGDAQRG